MGPLVYSSFNGSLGRLRIFASCYVSPIYGEHSTGSGFGVGQVQSDTNKESGRITSNAMTRAGLMSVTLGRASEPKDPVERDM